MVADRAKKAKTEEVEETAATELVDANLVHSIEKLQEIQDDLEKVNEEASDKVLEIEQKYNELRRPVYVKRSEIVKSIPNFWLTAFLSHPVLSDLLNEDDQKTFKYLESLDVEDFKDVKLGYSITFNFKENPYFEDKKLTKTFTFLDEGSTKITGTPIHWKEGMGATNGGESEKKGNKRPIPADDSFFSWFGDSQNKEIVEGLHDEVAEIIKEDLWPNPLKYFNNEPDEDSDEEVDEEEDSDEEGEGDEDEGEDDDDDDEEEE